MEFDPEQFAQLEKGYLLKEVQDEMRVEPDGVSLSRPEASGLIELELVDVPLRNVLAKLLAEQAEGLDDDTGVRNGIQDLVQSVDKASVFLGMEHVAELAEAYEKSREGHLAYAENPEYLGPDEDVAEVIEMEEDAATKCLIKALFLRELLSASE